VLAALAAPNLLKGLLPDVRRAIASVLPEHGKFDPIDSDNQPSLPIILQLMEQFIKDPEDDVRAAAAAATLGFARYFGVEFVLIKMQSIFRRMLVDTQWRVKISTIEILYAISVVSSLEFFEQNIFQVLIVYIQDSVSRVSHYVMTGLPLLAERFGVEWLTEKLMPQLVPLRDSRNYVQREVFLMAIAGLAKYFPERYRANYVYQPMIKMLRDGVNSVVLTALSVLVEHLHAIHPFRMQCELQPLIESLAKTAPPTVRELAIIVRDQLPS
jgi:hypothetical protein